MLQTHGLVCGYPRKPVVEIGDFQLAPGEIVAVFGPNGVGKSTFLETLCGELTPCEGKVTFKGESVGGMSIQQRSRSISFVPQNEPAVFDYTIRETVALGRLSQAYGLWETEDDWGAIEKALDSVGLHELADKPVTRISGGEHQLTLIARALASESPVMLLDEPTASLDLSRHTMLRDLLRKLTTLGTGILLTTHDINWGLAVADRCLCVADGKAVFVGPPNDALDALELAFKTKLQPVPSGVRLQVLVQ